MPTINVDMDWRLWQDDLGSRLMTAWLLATDTIPHFDDGKSNTAAGSLSNPQVGRLLMDRFQ